MTEVSMSIDIAAPPQRVWDVVMDPTRFGEWVTIHRGLKGFDEHHMKQVLCLRGVNFTVEWDLVRSRAPRHAEWHGKGPARSHAETEYNLVDDGSGGTRFDYRNVFKAPLGPLGAIASRALVGGLPEREARETLHRLKALLER